MSVLDKNEKKYEKVATEENCKVPVAAKSGWGVRHTQALLLFGALTCNLVARAHLSVTIVAMTDVPHTNVESQTNVGRSFNCSDINYTNNSDFIAAMCNDTHFNITDSEYALNNVAIVMSYGTNNISDSVAAMCYNNETNFNISDSDFNVFTISLSDTEFITFVNKLRNNNNETFNLTTSDDIISLLNNSDFLTLVEKFNNSDITSFDSGYVLNGDFENFTTGFNDSASVDDTNSKTINLTIITFKRKIYVTYGGSLKWIRLLAILKKAQRANAVNFDEEIGINTDKASFLNVYRTYSWSKATQEMVLGSFFMGYLIMMTPMGLVVQRFGGKLPLQIGLSISALLTFVTPWLAAWGDWKAVCATRVCMGLAQTGTFPGLHNLLAKWVPAEERGRLSTYVYLGVAIGSILACQIGGLLAASPFGWPSIFWTTGLLCLAMAVLLTVYGAVSPLHYDGISDEERNYILGRVMDESVVVEKPATPWRAILTSPPALAVFFGHVGTSATYMFFFAQIPTYLHSVLNVDVKSSGLLTSVPYVANFAISIFFGIVTDYCTNRSILTRKQTRMISNSIATVCPALCLCALSFTRNAALAVCLLVLALGALAGCNTGFMVNYIDLAPNFSGALIATGATCMNVMAVLLPVFVSQIITDPWNPLQWRIVLFAVAGFTFLCNAVYMCFISTDVQPWNEPITAQKNMDTEEGGKNKPK